MISLNTEYFDLKRICDSGQVFRMYERQEGLFDVYSGSRHLRLQQDKETGAVEFCCTKKEFDGYWKRYFDLDRDYGAIVRTALVEKPRKSTDPATGKDIDRRDEFVAAACSYGAGIRILHQDIWEMLISFIISQQKQIPSIRKCIEALCERFGEKKCEKIPVEGALNKEAEQHVWYTFPTAKAIAEGGPEGLKGLSLGYRERYIYESAVRYLSEGLPCDKIENMGLEAALGYFKSFCGVGEKVANCICLFGAGYVDAFPIDTHIKDILYREYYLKNNDSCEHSLKQSDYEELVRTHFDRFKGYRGIVQQWIFAWELVKDKTTA